ncbi:MAG: hypothetical protein AB2606_17660 [Candidatus Thiodiazotropha taylori]
MKGIFRIVFLLGLPTSLLLSSKAAFSTESAHYVGLSCVTDIGDVRGWHEDTIAPVEFGHDAPVASVKTVLLESLLSVSIMRKPALPISLSKPHTIPLKQPFSESGSKPISNTHGQKTRYF